MQARQALEVVVVGGERWVRVCAMDAGVPAVHTVDTAVETVMQVEWIRAPSCTLVP